MSEPAEDSVQRWTAKRRAALIVSILKGETSIPEAACLQRFETLRPQGAVPMVRSDNRLIFQSRRFRAACQDYRLLQEFITPYTPEQNGVIERFFRSLKEECVWQHQFSTFAEAQQRLRAWLRWYNTGRPHQALGYRSPAQFRAAHLVQVAS